MYDSLKSKCTWIITGLMLSVIYPSLVYGKALRSPVQSGDSIIIAKGDIPTPEKYKDAVQKYQVFVDAELADMVVQLESLQNNIQSGKLSKARAAYISAHQHYEAVRPVIMLFGNTDRVINPEAYYFPDKEKDYRFTGFHLVEYYLFMQENQQAALAAASDLLMKGRDLYNRVSGETIEFPKLVQASVDFIEMILETKLAGKENIYSQSDLADIASDLRGSQKIIGITGPFIGHDMTGKIKENNQRINDILKSYQLSENRYQPYSHLQNKDKMALYSLLSYQSEILAGLRARLDVDVYYKY
ncbi:EfeM/EfeO family lipoprotein [Salmonella enterica]|uniref:EfeM/EfeO family lipoprotein n=1 Tax=Salmonella enterica TaxID=28901 RepID=UPI002A0BB327|nr:EfeM/EfeO family lipoprotein [Salmonella enterica]EIH1699849.1 EfeM/EfeO family lipoprotein [Salmonella enterica]EIS9096780.1 EfeM/EfeO family lipoprotein [Salmonella enterica]EIT2139999.1 EfeM/EfeO family lipoprotein [Salmonella enterica]EIW3134358.1 EfeM/EfeO family lipoprotein [Salmonella enterica]